MKQTKKEREVINFQPFNEEWKIEMMKMEKEDIIFMYQVAGKEWLRQKQNYELQLQNSRNETIYSPAKIS